MIPVRDPAWQFVGVVVALVAVIAPLAVAWAQRRRKRLHFEVVSSTSLLTVREEMQGRLTILFDDQPVKDAFLSIFRIANTGNVPITTADFEQPIVVSFGEEARILTAEVVARTPKDHPAEIVVDLQTIGVRPTLFNSGDALTIKCLLTELSDVRVSARIVGVRAVSYGPAPDSMAQLLLVSGGMLTVAGVVTAIVLPVEVLRRYEYVTMGILFVGVVLLSGWMTRSRRVNQAFADVFERLSNLYRQ